MFTQRNFTPEGQFCELGGELVDTDHLALIGLCKELDIGIERLRPVGEDTTDIYDFGGKVRAPIGDLLDPAAQTAPSCPWPRASPPTRARCSMPRGAWTPRGLELDRLPLSKFLDSLKGETEPWVISVARLRLSRRIRPAAGPAVFAQPRRLHRLGYGATLFDLRRQR